MRTALAHAPSHDVPAQLLTLVIEDDGATGEMILDALARGGIPAHLARNGRDGLHEALSARYVVMVIDRMLPDLDGLSLVREARRSGIATPVLFLTAMGSVADRVDGLEGGGDDYLVKPFAAAELKARVVALARRPPLAEREPVLLGDGLLTLNRLTRSAVVNGRTVSLLPLQYKLLEVLMLNRDRVVTRTMLLERVWGLHFDPRTNIVETHISRLRSQIDRAGAPSFIQHLRGEGYVISTDA